MGSLPRSQEVVDYINAQANLTGDTGGDGSGNDLIGLDVCFKLDTTSTSIMMDTGHEFGVNTIKAIDHVTDATKHTKKDITYRVSVENGKHGVRVWRLR